MRRPALLALLIGLSACDGAPPAVPRPRPALAAAPAVTAAPAPAPTASATAEPEPSPLPPDAVTPEDAERVLYLATDLRTDQIRKDCPVTLERVPRIRCLIERRYGDDREARRLALTLFEETGSLAGLLPEETSDDGRGGAVHLLPARPVGRNTEHLTWILDAFRDYDRFLKGLSSRAAGGHTVAFRDRPVNFRFFYSEKGGNPSAFAINRNIGYNLFGTLNVSAEAVRDTLFHEIFHLNDARREDWSKRVLAPLFDAVVARCGRRSACLAPYSPTDTMIRGSFYAFIPQGGVREYAAELGLRYYREQRLMMEGKELPIKAFKCGPAENLTAWKAVADELFGGVDLVPACPAPAEP